MNSLDFFFSSRRRHTRWPRDWSSDVCSSDLPAAAEHATRASPHPGASILLLREVLDERAHQGPEPEALRGQHLQALFLQGCRGDRADSREQQTALPRLLAQSVEGVLLRGEVQPRSEERRVGEGGAAQEE